MDTEKGRNYQSRASPRRHELAHTEFFPPSPPPILSSYISDFASPPPPPPKDYPSSFPVDIKILPLTSLDSMSKRYTYINRRNFFFQSIPFDFDQKLTTLLPRPFHTSFQNIFITSRMNRFSRFTQTEALERERGFPSVGRVEIGQI